MRTILITLLVCVLVQACATTTTTESPRRTDVCFFEAGKCPKDIWFDTYDEEGRYMSKSIFYSMGGRDTTIEVHPFPKRYTPIRSFTNQLFFGKVVCTNQPGDYQYFTWSVGKGTLVETNIVGETWSDSPRTASTTDCLGSGRLVDVGTLIPEEILQKVWTGYIPP